MKKISLLFLKFLTGFITLYLVSVFINLFGMVIYALSVLIIAVPIVLNNAARFSLKKEIKLIEYEESKKFYKLLSGKTFGYIIIIITSLKLAFIILSRNTVSEKQKYMPLFYMKKKERMAYKPSKPQAFMVPPVQ